MRHFSFMGRRDVKLLFLFFVTVGLIWLFVDSVLNTISSKRRLPPHFSTIHDRALRGSIVSADRYTLSRSEKRYTATVYARSIEPAKMDLFVTLFSIYSGISKKDIEKRFVGKGGRPKSGRVVLSRSIDGGRAVALRELAGKLRDLRVFRRIENSRGVEVLYGLDVVENGESRLFPLKDTLTPAIGYVKSVNQGRYSRIVGVKGLERRYEKYLRDSRDGYVKGMRDVRGTIIRNSSSERVFRRDGYSLHLNITMELQRRVEKILDGMKKEIGAKEIVAAVMESSTGRLRALATSERYDPGDISKNDISKLNPKVTEYAYEPGSVMKPITLSIAMDKGLVNPGSWFETNNGRFHISRRNVITDDEPFASLTATDIIVHSSNIGITKIGWMLSGKEFHDRLKLYGFGMKSGVDLSKESRGMIRSPKQLTNKVNRATQSYGYGMKATFMQLFKAHSAFNNDGVIVTPTLVDYLESPDHRRYRLENNDSSRRVIGASTAKKMHKILSEVVKRGTGVAARYPGLDVGGKTGTAHIAEKGHYVRRYNSSFFGFANDDKGHRYSIGVLAIEPSGHHKYFASLSAVPTFKKIVDSLVELEYLVPNMDKRQREEMLEREKKRRLEAKRKQRERTRRIKATLKRQRDEIRKRSGVKRRNRPGVDRSRPSVSPKHEVRPAPPKPVRVKKSVAPPPPAVPDLF
jgi:cell division protein FtsI (penicillin-binding protein 3)